MYLLEIEAEEKILEKC